MAGRGNRGGRSGSVARSSSGGEAPSTLSEAMERDPNLRAAMEEARRRDTANLDAEGRRLLEIMGEEAFWQSNFSSGYSQNQMAINPVFQQSDRFYESLRTGRAENEARGRAAQTERNRQRDEYFSSRRVPRWMQEINESGELPQSTRNPYTRVDIDQPRRRSRRNPIDSNLFN